MDLHARRIPIFEFASITLDQDAPRLERYKEIFVKNVT